MTCACGNAARYIDETGALTCAICPIKAGRDSIKLASVPALLELARVAAHLIGGEFGDDHSVSAGIREIIGTKPGAKS